MDQIINVFIQMDMVFVFLILTIPSQEVNAHQIMIVKQQIIHFVIQFQENVMHAHLLWIVKTIHYVQMDKSGVPALQVWEVILKVVVQQ